MDCTRFEQLLNTWLDGDLDAAQQVSFDAHAARCRGCGAERAAYAQVRDLLESEPRYRAPQGFEATVLADLGLQLRPLGRREKLLRACERIEDALPGRAQVAIALGLLWGCLALGARHEVVASGFGFLGNAATRVYALSGAAVRAILQAAADDRPWLAGIAAVPVLALLALGILFTRRRAAARETLRGPHARSSRH